MRTLTDIRTEIEEVSDRRKALLERLSHGHDPDLVAEHKELEARLGALWDEQRIVRAHLRFGDRDDIIRRARAEERLDRAA
jgi:hypothetical protein